MIDQLLAGLEPRLPLAITDIEHNDPAILLRGDDWSLSIVCPWRLCQYDRLVCAYGDPDAEPRTRLLIGAEVIEVVAQSMLQRYRDPAFRISGGYSLEIFSDTDLDPWAVMLPERTFVGPLSDVPLS